MIYSNFIFLLFFYFCNIYANECYLLTKNNFMKFYLKLENYYLKKMLNEFGCRIDKVHNFACNKINSLSYKYNTLSYEEKEMLDVIGFFI